MGLDRSWVEAALVPLESMPLVPPPLQLESATDVQRFRSGREIGCDSPPRGWVRVLGVAGELLGVGEIGDPPGQLRPRVVLPPS